MVVVFWFTSEKYESIGMMTFNSQLNGKVKFMFQSPPTRNKIGGTMRKLLGASLLISFELCGMLGRKSCQGRDQLIGKVSTAQTYEIILFTNPTNTDRKTSSEITVSIFYSMVGKL